MQIKTVYGSYEVSEPLIELINSQAVQRLKNIYMGGVTRFINGFEYKDNSRYDHSINVLALLIRYGAGQEEQIAGLLHDASHTVFSHVADVLFKGTQDKCYQDEIHEWYLKKQGIDKILEKYNISLSSVIHKEGDFKRLEQDLPDICIDRLEYNLANALERNMLSQDDMIELLKSLKFDDNKWFFDNLEQAKTFAKIPLFFNEYYWAAPDQILAYKFMAQALKLAIDHKIITYYDIHFSSDDIVWNTLKNSENTQITKLLDLVQNIRDAFIICSFNNCDLVVNGKFRGIDPWVKVGSMLSRLSAIDLAFKQEFEWVKRVIDAGWPIKLLK
jgi:HD superfamily phosphohydrolase